jgi:N-acetylglutamate synthase
MARDQSFSVADIRAMELAAARAWPAGRIVTLDGWQVRLSGGGTRRGNSVLPLSFNGLDPETAITAVEAHFRAQKTRAYFQVVSIAEPPDLDARLAARGYTYEEPCQLLAKPLGPGQMPVDVEVTVAPTTDWLSVYTEPLDAVRRAAAPAVLASVPDARAFLLLRRDGQPVSTALAVVAPDGVAMVECVATRQTTRRSGGARIIMDSLEAWSFEQGARVAALQVVDSNVAARALYGRRGYHEVGHYHYRWRDVV